MNKDNNRVEIILNLVMVLLTVTGAVLMVTSKPADGALQASGVENFKFYTVLTNIFCGTVSLIRLIMILMKRKTAGSGALKLAALSGVVITFAVVAFFFGPLYGYPQFYQGSNLFFHLLLPIAAIIEFVAVRRSRIPFIYTVTAAVPTLIYGIGYMTNILINGIGGPWPDTNDFYAFLNWGWPVGITIFISITALAFGVSCLFRYVSNRRSTGPS